MRCPKCQRILVERCAAGVTLDECTLCGHFWFDGGEITRYVNEQRKSKIEFESDLPFVLAPGYAPLTCPRCNVVSLVGCTLGGVGCFRCSDCLGILIHAQQVLAVRAFKESSVAESTSMERDLSSRMPEAEEHVTDAVESVLDFFADIF